jgi:transposase
MPAYSPEFNSIESLWAIIKSRVKKVLNAERDVKMTQARFSEILQSCLDTVTPDESSSTARGGNR